jgi:hypothetical protein
LDYFRRPPPGTYFDLVKSLVSANQTRQPHCGGRLPRTADRMTSQSIEYEITAHGQCFRTCHCTRWQKLRRDSLHTVENLDIELRSSLQAGYSQDLNDLTE